MKRAMRVREVTPCALQAAAPLRQALHACYVRGLHMRQASM